MNQARFETGCALADQSQEIISALKCLIPLEIGQEIFQGWNHYFLDYNLNELSAILVVLGTQHYLVIALSDGIGDLAYHQTLAPFIAEYALEAAHKIDANFDI